MTSLSLFTFMHWRRTWQPTQCSCLENPRDGEACGAAVYGVAQSRTRLKRLRSSSSSKIIHGNCYSFFIFHFRRWAQIRDSALELLTSDFCLEDHSRCTVIKKEMSARAGMWEKSISDGGIVITKSLFHFSHDL